MIFLAFEECSQSAVSKHINGKSSGRAKYGRKRCTSRRDDRGLQWIIKQRRFKNLAEIQKEWNEAGVTASKTTTFRHIRKMGYNCRVPRVKPLLSLSQRRKRLNWPMRRRTVGQWSKVLFSDESKVCLLFGNQGPRVWRKMGEEQNPSCLRSSVKYPQSVMIWGAMSSEGVGKLCFLKSKVTATVYPNVLEDFMIPSAEDLYGDADFIFQQDLAPAHTARSTKTWFDAHAITVLDWPANSPDLNPIENLWGIIKRKMRGTRPKNKEELTASIKEIWASITPRQCHRLIASMPRRIEAVIKAKGFPTKY